MFSFTTTRFESTRGTPEACRRQSFAKCKQSKRRKAAPKFEAPLRYAPFRFKFHLASNFVCFPTALFLTIPKKQMRKVLIWGTGGDYNRHLNLIKYYESRGDYQVVGVTSDNPNIPSKVDGFAFYKKQFVPDIEFDYCFVALPKLRLAIEEAPSLHIPLTKLIPIRVLQIPNFNLEEYLLLKESRLSIFSSLCWAGLCYHTFALQVLSPTHNMFFDEKEFIAFLRDIDTYLALPIEFVETVHASGSEVEFFPL